MTFHGSHNLIYLNNANICVERTYQLNNFDMNFKGPALNCRGDVVTSSLCTSQRRRTYVPNETPDNVSMERPQDVYVVRLHNVLLERCTNLSKGRNNNVPTVRLHDVSNKSQMKHPTMFHWYVTKTSKSYVSTTSH